VRDAVVVEEAKKPSIAALTSEFTTHGRNMASFLKHTNLKTLILPYPLEAKPDDEILEVADKYYYALLDLIGAKK
jgi:hypothetical protein